MTRKFRLALAAACLLVALPYLVNFGLQLFYYLTIEAMPMEQRLLMPLLDPYTERMALSALAFLITFGLLAFTCSPWATRISVVFFLLAGYWDVYPSLQEWMDQLTTKEAVSNLDLVVSMNWWIQTMITMEITLAYVLPLGFVLSLVVLFLEWNRQPQTPQP